MPSVCPNERFSISSAYKPPSPPSLMSSKYTPCIVALTAGPESATSTVHSTGAAPNKPAAVAAPRVVCTRMIFIFVMGRFVGKTGEPAGAHVKRPPQVIRDPAPGCYPAGV
jgi:hypothetical protein